MEFMKIQVIIFICHSMYKVCGIFEVMFSIYLLSFKNSILFFSISFVEIFCFFIEIVLNLI